MNKDKGYLKALWSQNVELQKDYLVLENTTLAPADLILVFGNRTIIPALAKNAAKLYHGGMAPLILVSGGVKTADGRTEANAIAERLIALNVPQHKIIRDNLASDTLENVHFSRMTMTNHAPEHGVKSIIAIGHAVAGRRFLMTLKQNWPEAFAMASNVWPEKSLSTTWRANESVKTEIKSQFGRLERYFGLGYIREINLETINTCAASLNTRSIPPPLERAI